MVPEPETLPLLSVRDVVEPPSASIPADAAIMPVCVTMVSENSPNGLDPEPSVCSITELRADRTDDECASELLPLVATLEDAFPLAYALLAKISSGPPSCENHRSIYCMSFPRPVQMSKMRGLSRRHRTILSPTTPHTSPTKMQWECSRQGFLPVTLRRTPDLRGTKMPREEP